MSKAEDGVYPSMISVDARGEERDFDSYFEESGQTSSHHSRFMTIDPRSVPYNTGQQCPMGMNPQMFNRQHGPPPPWYMYPQQFANPYQPGYQYQRPASTSQYSEAVPRGPVPAQMTSVPFHNWQMPQQPMMPVGQDQEFARVNMGYHAQPPPTFQHQRGLPAHPVGGPANFNQHPYRHEGGPQPGVVAPRIDIERDFKISKTDIEKTRTIEVHNSDVGKSGRDKYFYFFENSRRGGGDIESFQISEDNIIIIMFEEKKVADHFVQEETVMVGDVNVRITQHEPLPVYTNKVLLQYPGAHLDEDSIELLMYIKARSNCDVQHRESGARPDALIVSFKERVDVTRLQDVCKQKLFKEKTVTVYEVQASRTLYVARVPDNISKETLHDYFETCKTDVQRVETSCQHGSYLVHVTDFRDAIRLVEMQHTLGDHVLEVSLCHTEIGCARTSIMEKKPGAGIKEPLFLDVSPLFGRFINKTPMIKSELEKRMNAQGMDISISANNKICITTSSNYADPTDLVKSAKSILHDLVEHESIRVPQGLDAQSLLDGLSHDPREVKLYTDRITISIVGYFGKTSEVKSKVEERIRKRGGVPTTQPTDPGTDEKPRMESTDISSPQASHHQQTMTVKPLASQYLLDHSFQNEVQKKHIGVKLNIDAEKGEVIVEGPDQAITQSVQIMIHEKVNNLETTELQPLSEQKAALLNNIGVKEILLVEQNKNGIVASWKSKKYSVEIIAGSRKEAGYFQKLLTGYVLERIISLEANMFTLFSSASWRNELQKLHEVFQDTFSITPMQDEGYLVIVGLKDTIDALYDVTSSYLVKNEVQEKVIPFQKGEMRFLTTHLQPEVDKIAQELQQNHGNLTIAEDNTFTISGPKVFLEKVTDELKKLIQTIHCRKETLTKPGMAKLMRSDKGNTIRKHVENKHRCVVETEDDVRVENTQEAAASTSDRPIILAVSILASGRKVCVRKGDITTFRVGALVNAANGRLEHCGGLAKAIVEKGGKSIQKECSRYIEQHGNLLEGDAMVSRPGNLPCNVLIHAVGPNWNGGDNKEKDYLREVVEKSLEFADEKECVSIAIPGLSTGIFGYPPGEATEVITKAVDVYFKGNQGSSLKDVYFCDSKDSTLNAFIAAMEKVFRSVIETPATTSTTNAPRGATADGGRRTSQTGKNVVLELGEIAKQTAEVIINTAPDTLDLTQGAVSTSLMDVAGPGLQKEATFKHCTSTKDIIVTGGYNLKCKKVYHIRLSKVTTDTEAEKEIRGWVQKCLDMGNMHQTKSMRFPALGTGNRDYPRKLVAECMFDTIQQFWMKNPWTTLADIAIVLYSKDDKTKKAFEEVKKHLDEHATHGGRRTSQTGKNVVLELGEIAKQTAEVIINTASDTLDLTQGAVSKSLMDVAGPGLQREATSKRRTSSKDIIVTGGYNLKCKKVYHIRLSKVTTDTEAEKEIRGWVQKCLDMGNMHQTKSMRFPALGTGNLKYPRELVAECMFDTIQQFWMKNPMTNLADIAIVLYSKDDKTKKAFEEVKKHLDEHATQKFRPVLKRGDITRFGADVIVNATDETLNLNRGSLSKTINEAAGPSLSAECRQKYPNGCPRSGVAVTSAGLLNAKSVYHVLVPFWNKDNGEKDLMNAVKFSLEEAHTNNHQSILFPTLGLGLQDYKKDVAARCMYKAIDAFWASHPGTSLTEVQIVIFEDATAKEFEKVANTFFSSRPVSRKSRMLKSESLEEEHGTSINVSEGVTFGNIHFSLVHGDLLKENVDCLICTVHSQFDLKRGIINRILLQRFPSSFTDRDVTKGEELETKGYTVTQMSTGPFQQLIHIEPFFFSYDIAKFLKKCLQVADELKSISVALPALGQGREHHIPERILIERLYDTLIALKDLKHVKEVRLVIFEHDMYEQLMSLFSALVKKQGLKAKRFFQGPHLKKDAYRRPRTHRQFERSTVESSVDILFFTDKEENINSAKQELLTISDKEFDDDKVENPAIKLFNEQKTEQLYAEARRRGVVLTIDVRLGRCRVKGIKNDIHEMIKRILEICIDQKDDFNIACTVQWCYIDETAEEELVKYDKDTNKKLEKAYREEKDSYRLEDTDGKWYIFDFNKMVEFMEDDPTSQCAVLRKDLLNAAEVDFPPNWQLGVAENLKTFTLDQSSIEFQRVASKFARTQKHIIKIQRIQNKTLYRQYQAKKQLFEQRSNNTKPVERELWHGTAQDAIPSINKDGFNRSYCGKNAVAYGNGVYFAVNPSYSTQDKYARKDHLGNQYIYLVDVLTGEYTMGKTGMRVPPPRDPQDPAVLFDSVVENDKWPTMYVIFNDTQAYPKYLITFR